MDNFNDVIQQGSEIDQDHYYDVGADNQRWETFVQAYSFCRCCISIQAFSYWHETYSILHLQADTYECVLFYSYLLLPGTYTLVTFLPVNIFCALPLIFMPPAIGGH